MKKKFLAFSLIFAFILSCPAFIAGLMPEKAMADGETDIIAMEGAAIRIKDPYGLRFEAKISAADVNSAQSLGMYLCPTDLLPNGEFPVDLSGSLVVGDKPDSTHFIKKVEIPKETLVDSENPDVKIARLTLIEIKECNFDRKFSAMAYVIKPDTAGTEVRSTPITRSVSYVARKALADPASGLSAGDDGYNFVNGIVTNSNDFFIATAGVTPDNGEGNKYKGDFSHKVILDGTDKNIVLSLGEQFEKDVICTVKLYARADAAGITIDDKTVDTAFTEITIDNIQVTDNKVTLVAKGSGSLWLDDIRAVGMTSLGTENISAMGEATITRHDGTVEYNAGGKDENDGVGFTLGRTVADAEYLVMKFRYNSDMDNRYFASETYLYEGLHIKGQGNTATGCRHEFAIFDENYYDYTLYERTEGSTSYEGDNIADPCGSAHGTKEVSTKAGTWYYAVAPANGNYTSISSPNQYLHIEIADIYSVTKEVKDQLFEAQHYKVNLVMPATPYVYMGEPYDIGTYIIENSFGIMKAEDLQYIPSYDIKDGKIVATAPGPYNIKVVYSKDPSIWAELHYDVDDGIDEISLNKLYVVGEEGNCGQLTNNTYNSGDHTHRESLLGIRSFPDDKYLVIKFKVTTKNDERGNPIKNDFLLYKGTGQTWSEYRNGAPSEDYDYAFICGEPHNNQEYTVRYNGGDYPSIGLNYPLYSGIDYYLVAPNKGAYEGLTSNCPLECQITGIWAYSAAARSYDFGM